MPNKHPLSSGHLKTTYIYTIHTELYTQWPVGIAVKGRSKHKAQSSAVCKQCSRFLNSPNAFYRKIKANFKN